MLKTYRYPRYSSARALELDCPGQSARHPVVVVGAGPVGLALAIDLAQRGQPVLLLDDDNTVSVGSRGLCYAKRTLEILDRLGCGQAVVDKGVTWNVGRTFLGEHEVFKFNLLPEPGHRRPAMVNLQQYHLEQFLVERAQALPGLDLRWESRVIGVDNAAHGVQLQVQSAHGNYTLSADWLVVADGARSPLRRLLGLDLEGKVFQDRFLIADVVLKQPLFAEGAAERWFWFDPPFHRGQSVLLHREADEVWRIDFQLGWDADPELEKQPERVRARISAMLGPEHEFELEWVSVYTFQCRRMQRLRHGRTLFVGDAAHQVSPFGARGANSGVQDADNLGWKLDLVLQGLAAESLLDSYDSERGAAAAENLLNSTRSTDFITPKSQASHDLRQAVLSLAREHDFARLLVNSGRLSVPTHYRDSPLNTADAGADLYAGVMHPGAPLADAPLLHHGQQRWLLQALGPGFTLLLFGTVPLAPDLAAELSALQQQPVQLHCVEIGLGQGAATRSTVTSNASAAPSEHATWIDHQGLAAQRLDARPGTAYLIRPDQHVAARWRALDVPSLLSALKLAVNPAMNSATNSAMNSATSSVFAEPQGQS